MASTRAKARCLRDLTCSCHTALEELGDLSEVIGDESNLNNPAQTKKNNVKSFPGRPAKAANESKPVDEVKPATAQELPTKPDDYPKEPAQINASQALPPADKPAEDKQASTRQVAKPSNGNGKGKSDVKIPVMSEAQKSAIMNLSRRRNISVTELENFAMKSFNVPLENLSSADASAFIRQLQTAA
jgi:hypothetical protein